MRESDLYIPVRDWMRARGLSVHAEIFGCDVVGVGGEELIAVELKLGSPDALRWQLARGAAHWADWVFGALPHRPKKPHISAFRSHGFGLLIVEDGRVAEIVKPKRQPYSFHKKHAYRLVKLSGRSPAQDHETAGLPCCRQLRQQRLARA